MTDPSTYASSFDDEIAATVREAAERVGGFRSRLSAADLEPEEIGSAAALDRLPVMSKDELLEAQRADPPFGGLLAPDADVRRIFQSPGPLYEPELAARDPWRWEPALRAAGFSADDLVLNAFGYHLSPAGAMFEEACLALGARVVPAGVGSKDLQVAACDDLGVTAYIGTPSYLKALLEEAEDRGVELAIERAFVSAEPLPPSLRTWLRDRVPTVLQGYGTAEAGNLGYECERMDGLHVPDDALVEVCDLDSGESRWDGTVGQVVVTLLHPEYPLVRFGTGDLSAYVAEDCPCGRPTPRLRGFLGRVGEAVKVRGMFLHPRQAQEIMDGMAGVEAYRFVVDRASHRDVLRVEVVTTGDPDAVSTAVHDRVRSALRFDAQVQVVETLPDDADVMIDVRSWE